MLELLYIPLLFLLQLLISESIFLVRTPRRSHFALRLAGAVVGYNLFALALNYLFSFLPSAIPVRILFFLIFFSASVPAVYFCFAIPLPQAVFATIAGYSVEHIADSVVKIITALVNTNGMSFLLYSVVFLLLPYILCAALCYHLLVKHALLDEMMQYGDKRVLAVSAMNLVICLVLSVVMDALSVSPASIVIGKVYAILGCVLCLTFQVGLFRDGKMARDNKALQQMMLMERSQHRISKETIELINMKCHDLKHQLDHLEGMSSEKQGKNIAKISQAIMIYDSMIKTGNETLDMVLMEKKLHCDKYHIRFTFLGEASGLGVMDEVDIYALFGNMLDNAIESLRLEPGEEKRVATLNVYSRKKMLYICMDNYLGTPVVYKNGELQTTKQQEPGMHGYGVKSIAYIVNEYKGDLLIKTEDSHFVLEIMLPEDDKMDETA